MPFKELPLFNAAEKSYWLVDDTGMTIVTDASLPLGRVRENMQADLAKSARLLVSLPCVHFSASFQGVVGTHVHGRGWMLHKPTDNRCDLWEMAMFASNADWAEAASPELGK